MPIPFPGMNPYLEHPDLWPAVQQRFVAALANRLANHISSQPSAAYHIQVQERHYQVSGEDALVVGSPGLNWGESDPADLRRPAKATIETTERVSLKHPIAVLIPVPQEISEPYIEIRDETGEAVTIVEVLSPKKKRPGRGRDLYERQRENIFGSHLHFVEIDLLRGWEPPSIYGPDEAGDYRVLVSRSEQRPRADLYTWTVAEPIPPIVVPLKGNEDVQVMLKPAVDEACDRTDLLVNYEQAPLPPLRFEETLWLDDFLQEVGMRPRSGYPLNRFINTSRR